MLTLKKAKAEELKFRTLEFKIEQLRHKSPEAVEIKVNTGKLRGAKRRTIYNDEYCSFEGIPYAQPPLGELRFRAPRPVEAWKGVRDCSNYAAKPVQLSITTPNEVEGSEDCLYLNVYTNNIKPGKARPVLVYIYGGAFAMGEANPEWFGPDYFMKKDVVLVTVQYRLGALGFLSLKDRNLHIPGNAGLKDQILALKWIKRNIAAFGGNPDCVTLFGESAGGMSVHALMLSEQSKGLFHRAIAQSGFATCDLVDMDCSKRSFNLAQVLGYEGEDNEKEILKFLLTCSSQEIIKAQGQCLNVEDMKENNFMAFGVCIEPYFTPHTVMHKPAVEMMEHAWGNTIPFMLGCCSHEGLMMMPIIKDNPNLMEYALETGTSLLPKGVVANLDSPEALEKAKKLLNTHAKDGKATLHDFLEMQSFKIFLHPMYRTINLRLQHAPKTSAMYLYRFDFDSDKLKSPYRLMLKVDGFSGASHTDDLNYLFSNALSRPLDTKSSEYRTIERMISLWTSFAEYGTPNMSKLPGMSRTKWHRLSKSDKNFKCLNISDKLEFIPMPELSKLQAWEELYNIHRDLPKTSELVDLSVYVKSSL